jgi:hypothetical protein
MNDVLAIDTVCADGIDGLDHAAGGAESYPQALLRVSLTTWT